MMKPKEIEKDMRTIAKAIMPDFINDLYNRGIINDVDFADRNALFSKVRKELNSNQLNFEITIDHRESLLKVAEQEYLNGHNGLSNALFATFIEHTLNKIIHLECTKKKINKKTEGEIIRGVGFIGKCTWLLTLFGLPALKQNYLISIMKIAEERNSYMHYKWKPETDTDKVPDLDNESKQNKEKYLEIKKTIKYLKGYESRHEFKGKKTRTNKLI